MQADLWQYLILWSVVLCILPLVFLTITAVLLVRYANRWVAPDPEVMYQQYIRLVHKNPHKNRKQLVDEIIHKQSLKAGIVGVITGFGGFYTLPFMLPVDLYASYRIQSAMIDFIAYAYGHPKPSAIEQQERSFLVISGGKQVARITTDVMFNVMMHIAGKAFSSLIPFIGSILSFGVNYYFARSTGRQASKYYSHRNLEPPHPAQLNAGVPL